MQNVVATIGIFDGVHRGHQKILKKLVKESKKEKRPSLVITFHPHPRKVLNHASKIPLLISLEHRLKLIKEEGIDFCKVIKFTKSLSQMKPDDFIKKVLIKRFNIKTLVVGSNFSFGYKEKGDVKFLQKISRKYNFKVFSITPVTSKKRFISSTRIRKKIEKGKLKDASFMLGRPVTALGTVRRGRRVGKKLGFPTANIDPHHEAIPPSGVYAVNAKVQKRLYKGILNIGRRPTFTKDIDPTIELHIFNFKKNIYGKDIEIIFKRKIRNEERFSSAKALQKQIKSDILRAM